MNKKISTIGIVVLVLATLFVFTTSTSDEKIAEQSVKKLPDPTTVKDGIDAALILGVFEGIIPCADCERIKMKLTLYQDPATLGAAGYTLDRVYVGKGDKIFSEQGTWDYLRGNEEDPDATIYGLNLDQPKEEQLYFLKVGDDKVTMLDQDMNPIKSTFNYTLKLTTTN